MTNGLVATSTVCAFLLGVTGCAPSPPPAEHAPPRTPQGEPPRAPTPPAPPPPAAAPAAPANPAESPPAAALFPPRDFTPPSPKSAADGDGRWTPLGSAELGERAATTPPLFVRTVVHPHPDSKWITVTLAAVDLARVRVKLVAGTEDLSWARLPDGDGLVPAADRGALLAVMNGGFQPKHGHWGLMANGTVVSPARDGGCTLVLRADGTAHLGTWTAPGPGSGVESFRQTPPCLVEAGAVHPDLVRGRDKAWAGHARDLQTRRRSAVGLDATGGVLFYAIGEEAEPRWLAQGMLLAGAAAAAELDINWYWTRFLLFGEVNGALRVTSTLIPKMEHQVTGYVERGSTRDFLYLVRK